MVYDIEGIQKIQMCYSGKYGESIILTVSEDLPDPKDTIFRQSRRYFILDKNTNKLSYTYHNDRDSNEYGDSIATLDSADTATLGAGLRKYNLFGGLAVNFIDESDYYSCIDVFDKFFMTIQ